MPNSPNAEAVISILYASEARMQAPGHCHGSQVETLLICMNELSVC